MIVVSNSLLTHHFRISLRVIHAAFVAAGEQP